MIRVHTGPNTSFLDMNIKDWGRAGLLLLLWHALCLERAYGNPQVGHEPEFGGVTARFEILSPIIVVNRPLKVRVTLSNTSSSAVTFRYFDGQTFIHHMLLYDKKGVEVTSSRVNTHSGELAATTISLNPRQSTAVSESVDLNEFYDLVPGEYSVQFQYNLGLIEDDSLVAKYMKRYHSRDTVPWGTQRLRFSVRK